MVIPPEKIINYYNRILHPSYDNFWFLAKTTNTFSTLKLSYKTHTVYIRTLISLGYLSRFSRFCGPDKHNQAMPLMCPGIPCMTNWRISFAFFRQLPSQSLRITPHNSLGYYKVNLRSMLTTQYTHNCYTHACMHTCIQTRSLK